jgi:hypothetical protein
MVPSRSWTRFVAATITCFTLGCAPANDGDEESADDDVTEPEPDPGPFNGSKCNTVSRDEIAEILGHPDLAEPRVDEFGSGAQCTYATTENPAAVIILYYEDTSLEEFTQKRQGFDESGQPTSDIAGLGEAAFLAETAPGVGAVGALKGTESICVSGLGAYTDMQALADEILTRL